MSQKGPILSRSCKKLNFKVLLLFHLNLYKKDGMLAFLKLLSGHYFLSKKFFLTFFLHGNIRVQVLEFKNAKTS